MHTRQLGKTEMHITPLGLGTWAMGGHGWADARGPQDDEESIKTIHRVLELGINWIDTAAVYGLGHAEEIIGKAIKGHSEKPYIFTKCSLVWNTQGEISQSLKASSIQREIEGSLKRLGVDVIDLYQIYWPMPEAELEEGWQMLAKLKQEGKVQAIGISHANIGQLRRLQKIAPIDTIHLPYSLLHREIEQDVLPYCAEHNLGVIACSPMLSGLLTGRMTKEGVTDLPDSDCRKRDPQFQEPHLSRALDLASFLTDIGYPHNLPAGVVAVAWALRNAVVTGAAVGSRHPSQIEEIIMAAEFRLDKHELNQIEKFLLDHNL